MCPTELLLSPAALTDWTPHRTDTLLNKQTVTDAAAPSPHRPHTDRRRRKRRRLTRQKGLVKTQNGGQNAAQQDEVFESRPASSAGPLRAQDGA